jgi:uncharacterized protein YprB with RNaseH-like and TPR domain
MLAPIHRLKKAELVWLATHKCKAHSHTYISHYSCYLKEVPSAQERVGFFDIETTGFDAGFGMMLSWAIKVGGEKKIYHDVITADDMEKCRLGDEDKRIVRSCVEKILTFDRVVTHYGNDFRFDAPFLRTRAVSLGIPFPAHGTLKHTDTYPILKKKFKLGRNRLETACRTLIGETDKTHLNPQIWRRAGRGDKRALSYVLKHNIADVVDLEKVYEKIKDFAPHSNVSF